MPRTVTASAPGKLILFGEHAVVYGRPALVAAVDLRLTARLAAGDGAAGPGAPVRLRVPQLGLDEATSWAEVAVYAAERRELWRAWAERRQAAAYRAAGGPGPGGGSGAESDREASGLPTAATDRSGPAHGCGAAAGRGARGLPGAVEGPREGAASGPRFPAAGPGDAGHVLKVALGEAAAALAASAGLGESAGIPLEVEVASELPAGAGFGSSAAAAVVVVAGYLALAGAEPTAEEIGRIALEVERRQHGLPSGVDAATVLRGGVLWAERRGGGPGVPLAVEPLSVAGRAAGVSLLGGLAVFDSGPPAETTGAVVAAVRDRAAEEPDRYDALWGRIETATRGFRSLLVGEEEAAAPRRAGGEDVVERAVELLRECEAALEAAGVVPGPVVEVVRAIEAAGGAAKVSGAGSLAGPGGGTVLALHPEGPEALAGLAAPAGWVRRRVTLGGPGLRLEAASGGGR